MTPSSIAGATRTPIRPTSVREWRASVLEQRALPIIVIAGSRGKTTVARLVEMMLGDRFRIATRSPAGVSILGEPQSGELEPWARVTSMLESGELDLAIWEVDWATANTLDSSSRYGLLAITNVCANREACFLYGDARAALRSLPGLARSVEPSGTLVLNGDDHAVSMLSEGRESQTVFAALGIDSPEMEDHWQAGGVCGWVESDHLCLGHNQGPVRLARTTDLQFALEGVAAFQVHNALMASAIGYSIGIRSSAISTALRSFRSDVRDMPGSFNLMLIGGVPTIIDRPAPSWFLRPVIRALRDFRHGRLLTVIGLMENVPPDDLQEVGRLFGRVSSAMLVAAGRATDGYAWQLLRDGSAKNEVPPVFLPFATEQAAFRKATAMARPADTIYYVSATPEHLQHHVPVKTSTDHHLLSQNGQHP